MQGHTHRTWGRRADLHFHLLPGADDGPATIEESLELAWAALRDAIGTIVATPHIRPEFVSDVRELPERVGELQVALEREAIPLCVRRGGELGHEMVGRLSQPELEMIAVGPPSARWVLLEAPLQGGGEDFDAAADELRDRGFGILIAHPERSPILVADDCAGLRRQLVLGALAQLNACSLQGRHGDGIERAAFRLVEQGLAAAVASDAHGADRPPALGRALRLLLDRGVEQGVARGLISAAPRRLLARGILAPAVRGTLTELAA
jgi:protein-tyrosine phosphatase